MITITAQVNGVVALEQAAAFEQVVHIDVPAVFRGRGVVAAVSQVCDQQGSWRQVGESRRIVLKDGGSLIETITAYQPPARFEYRLHSFQGPLRWLVSRIEGEWLYRAQGAAHTEITWRYQFHPCNAWIQPLTWCFVRALWMPYMRQVMRTITLSINT